MGFIIGFIVFVIVRRAGDAILCGVHLHRHSGGRER